MVGQNYAASHETVRISAKRFEASPFIEKYANDQIVYGIYCNRFYAMTVGDDAVEQYWKLRRQVLLFDVPEKPLEIRGPDAVALLERIFTRRIDTMRLWRGRYAIACTPAGGILMDGVLMRLDHDHFWYVTADGEFESWLLGHAEGLAVSIRDPKSRVLQIQGPNSMDVLRRATGGQVPENFGYFHVGQFDFGGQQVLVSRTGWTGEMGFEVYPEGEHTDHPALWDHLMAHGQPYGMEFSALESMGIRRIEAGILDNGTDIDRSMTPYEAGLGDFVDLDKTGFIGCDALMQAKHDCLLYGLSSLTVPFAGLNVRDGNEIVATMTCGAWSPSLEQGVGFVRFNRAGDWLGRTLSIVDREGASHACEIVKLPFLDPEKKIPRGLV